MCLDGFDWRKPMIDPELLRALVAVDIFGGFRPAGRALRQSPETIRRRIARLERHYGAKLCGGRPSTLTKLGRLVVEPARLALVTLARF